MEWLKNLSNAIEYIEDKIAININPFTHVINVLRSLILYGTVNINNLVFAFILFIFMGSISFIWALHGLKKELDL